MIFSLMAVAVFMFTGCASMENITKGVVSKGICASGTVMMSRADETGISNLLVRGMYISNPNNSEMLSLEMSESPSIFNSDAIEKKTFFFFATDDKDRMDEVIKKVTPAVAK